MKIFYKSKKTIEEIACRWLLDQKGRKLSNTNVECFTEGFQTAQGLFPSCSKWFVEIIEYLKGVREERINNAGYSGRHFDDQDAAASNKAEEIAKKMEELLPLINEYNEIVGDYGKL